MPLEHAPTDDTIWEMNIIVAKKESKLLFMFKMKIIIFKILNKKINNLSFFIYLYIIIFN